MQNVHKLFLAVLLAISLSLPVALEATAPAVPYGGGGVGAGITQAGGLATGGGADIRPHALAIAGAVVFHMGVAAVAVTIIAAFFLIVGGVSEENRERARKIIVFMIVGLFLILATQAILFFIDSAITGAPVP